jgi:hypothetical protein
MSKNIHNNARSFKGERGAYKQEGNKVQTNLSPQHALEVVLQQLHLVAELLLGATQLVLSLMGR